MREYCVGDNIYLEIMTGLHVFSSTEYKNIVYMRKNCHVERIDLKISTDLQPPPGIRKNGFWSAVCMSISLYGWMHTSLARERLQGFYLWYLMVYPSSIGVR
jgi:hypothetical protein